MMKIRVIGCGALGARHVQALGRLVCPVQVQLIDPSTAARERAAASLLESGRSLHQLLQFNSVDELHGPCDLAIVATNSRERLPVVARLCDLGCESLVLEKILFPRIDEYAVARDLFDRSGANVWVNCARRVSPRFGRLKSLINGRPFSYRVEGINWGLACNVVHHLDEWTCLANSNQIGLSARLDPSTFPAKRVGYQEVSGSVLGTMARSEFLATCTRVDNVDATGDRTVTIDVGDTSLVINQLRQELVIQTKGRVISQESYPIAKQSEATAWHVASILAGGEPDLPRFDHAAMLHIELLKTLLPLFQLGSDEMDECPIT